MHRRYPQAKLLSRGQRTPYVILALVLKHDNAALRHPCSFLDAVRQSSAVLQPREAFRPSLCGFQDPLRVLVGFKQMTEVQVGTVSTVENACASVGFIPSDIEWVKAGGGLTIQTAPSRFDGISTP